MTYSHKYDLITDHDALGAIANRIEKAGVIGLDIETLGFDPLLGEIRLMQLNIDDEYKCVIDLFQTKGLGPVEGAIRRAKAIWIAHNTKFEQKWLWHKYRIRLWPAFCTFRASALLTNGKKELKNNLWDLYRRVLGVEPEVEDLGGSNWSGTLTQAQLDYAADDVMYLPKLRVALKSAMAADGLLTTALIEFESVLAEASIELNGFWLDKDQWLGIAVDNLKRSRECKDVLLAEMPHPSGQLGLPGMLPSWNLDSPSQMLKALERKGIKVENTREPTLAMVAAKHPVIKQILDYREASKQYSSFGPEFLQYLHPVTGRIHTSFFAMLTTGRYSSSNPNLQQIPRDIRFRRCFAAAPGKRLVAADYSGIEMRIVAEIADDPVMIDVFRRGEDIHTATAAIIAGVAVGDVTKPQRQAAKPVNFGLIYGMQAPKLVIYSMSNYGVAMTVKEAETYRNRYFGSGAYEGIARWHSRTMREGQRRRWARTMSGRIRYLDETAYNEYYNTPVQGTGADALKTALPLVHAAIQPYGDAMKIVHIVHDEIILEVDDNPECIAAAKALLQESMQKGMQKFLKKVPVVVDPSDGPTWADCH